MNKNMLLSKLNNICVALNKKIIILTKLLFHLVLLEQGPYIYNYKSASRRFRF